jgi:hypothetical protein
MCEVKKNPSIGYIVLMVIFENIWSMVDMNNSVQMYLNVAKAKKYQLLKVNP